MTPLGAVVLLFVGSTFLGSVCGHGRLMDPPARNAMWRFGYPNHVNYNDNELYCGGFVVHYQKNKGKCGVCGDNYRDKTPRPHEAGGTYGNGIISKFYVSGQVIDIVADLTANHWGYMEIRFCPHNNPDTVVTQECLDQYVLPIEGTSETRYHLSRDNKKPGTFKWRVKLPDGITCSNCVIQWKYFAGNTWYLNKTDTNNMLKEGPQETFINCADVSIITNVPTGPFPADAVVDNPWQLYFRNSFPGVQRDKNAKPGPHGFTPLVVRAQLSVPVGYYKRYDYMHEWCKTNCLSYPPNCHPNYCQYVYDCEAVGEFRKQKFADNYCQQECLRYPSNCSETLCHCF